MMPPARFEPAIPANERPQTYALDHAANGIPTKSLALNLMQVSELDCLDIWCLWTDLTDTTKITGT
jgi:hypothetical protein